MHTKVWIRHRGIIGEVNLKIFDMMEFVHTDQLTASAGPTTSLHYGGALPQDNDSTTYRSVFLRGTYIRLPQPSQVKQLFRWCHFPLWKKIHSFILKGYTDIQGKWLQSLELRPHSCVSLVWSTTYYPTPWHVILHIDLSSLHGERSV